MERDVSLGPSAVQKLRISIHALRMERDLIMRVYKTYK